MYANDICVEAPPREADKLGTDVPPRPGRLLYRTWSGVYTFIHAAVRFVSQKREGQIQQQEEGQHQIATAMGQE